MPKHLLEQIVPVLLLGAARDPRQRHMLVVLLLLQLGRGDVSGHGAQLASDQRQDEASAAQPARVGVRSSFPGGKDLVLGCLLLLGAERGVCKTAEVVQSTVVESAYHAGIARARDEEEAHVQVAVQSSPQQGISVVASHVDAGALVFNPN
jgi:hypothetical protein